MLFEHGSLRVMQTIIYIITMTKYSNMRVVIILQEEGQDGEEKDLQ